MAVAQKNNSKLIYDSAGAVQGADANTSLESLAPDILFIEGLATGTTCAVQVRPDETAIWYELAVVDGAVDADAIVYIDRRFNFVRTVRAGADDFKVFTQA